MNDLQSIIVMMARQYTDTSCILAWLIEQGYEVYAFMADVGQEEVKRNQLFITFLFALLNCLDLGFRSRTKEGTRCWCQEVLLGGSLNDISIWVISERTSVTH
jgi:hypothetical protein